MTPLRVGIIGYGLAGAVFHAPLVAATEGLEVAAIVTANPGRRAQAARDFPGAALPASAAELWEQSSSLGLVVIASTNRSHAPLALAAIERGLPVMIDKPMAASAADARRVIAAAKNKGVPLTVFQNRRWDGDFLTLRTLIEERRVGKIVRLESRFERYRPRPKDGAWRELADPEEAGGLLFDLGPHLIDQAVLLFGPPESVYAEMGTDRPGALVDDDTFLALSFPGGVHAHLWMNVTSRILGPRFRLIGLNGAYVKYGLDPQEPQLRDGLRPGDPMWGRETEAEWGQLSTDLGGLHFDGAVETVPGQYEHFYALTRDALAGGGALPVDPEDSLRGLEIIEAARESATRKTVVRHGSD